MDDLKKEKPEKVVPKKENKAPSKPEVKVEVVKRRHKPTPLFTFDRYFASLGKPAHHKAGMRAFLKSKDLKAKKPLDTWKNLFKSY